MSFDQILFSWLVQNDNLFLLLLYGVLELYDLLLKLIYIHVVIIFFACSLKSIFIILYLLRHKEHFCLSFSNFHCINCILLVKLNQGLF